VSYPPWSPPFPMPADPNDPLVTPPGAGVGAWWARLLATIRGTWRELLPLVLLCVGVPTALFNGLTQVLIASAVPTSEFAPDTPPGEVLASLFEDLAPALGITLLSSIVLTVFTALAWGAGAWVITRWAAAQPVALGPAMGYGLRRLPRVLGWSLVVTLMVLVGFCLCVLPGFYFAYALCLALCVAVFERANPVSRSFALTHRRFGLALGRILIVAAVFIAPTIVLGIFEEVVLTAIGVGAAGSVGGFLVSAVFTLVSAPLYLVLYVGSLVTYAELRAWEAPLTSGMLAGELVPAGRA
jgi:hypothetical protein